MVKIRTIILSILFASAALPALFSYDVVDGRMRLVINEKTGRFNIYYRTNPAKEKFDPLLWDRDKYRTTFLAAFVNNKTFRLGENRSFVTHVRGTTERPVLAFESKELSITQEFSFARTATADETNAIRIDIKVENWGTETLNVGVRQVLDTFLGEKSRPHFSTNVRPIQSETLIDRTTLEQWWVTRNSTNGLMGSIFLNGIDLPDTVYFANWRRLSQAKWKPEYQSGRNFNKLPLSRNDSAVAYYLDVAPLDRWEQRAMTIFLGIPDRYGFENPKLEPYYEDPPVQYRESSDMLTVPDQTPSTTIIPYPYPTPAQSAAQPAVTNNMGSAAPSYTPQSAAPMLIPVPAQQIPRQTPVPTGPMRADIASLRVLIRRIDELIYSGEAVSEADLKKMEDEVAAMQNRYTSLTPPAPRY